MSGRGDHQDDMVPSARRDGDLDDALDTLILGRPAPSDLQEVAAVLDGLRAVGRSAAPAPTVALERFLASPALLAGEAVTDLDVGRQRRAVRAGAAAMTVAVLTLGSVGVAAAQGRLPDRAQDAVASAVSALTPFTVPRPHRVPAGLQPAGTPPTQTPSPRATPTPAAGAQRISRTAPEQAPAAGSDARDGGSSLPSGGGDSPGSVPARRTGTDGSQDASASPAEPQPVETSSGDASALDSSGTSSGSESGTDPQPSPSPTQVPDGEPGADLSGSGPDATGVDGTDVSASPDS